MKTTRSLELIYFSFLPTPTKDAGVVYTFFTLDDFSQFVFLLGIDTELTEFSIVLNLISLTQNEDFNKVFKNEPFVIMLPFEKSEIMHNLLTEVLTKFNGSITYNEETVTNKTKSFIKQLSNF
ncbi:hypothetical protein [Flavobacterium sp.]